MKVYIESQITPLPKKYFAHKCAIETLGGVALVWFKKKDARDYYKQCGMKCPKLETWIAIVKGFSKLPRNTR